ncbi:MAG: alanine racemase [Bellilinea sp.]|nr:MAG: alanine racemase [Bellilinea sp.]
MNSPTPTSWLEIDLNAIQNNYMELCRISGTKVAAVVKANAYGHGLIRVSQAVLDAGGEWLAVARFEEAEQLRKNWIMAPILVLGFTPPDRVVEAAKENIRLTVFDAQTAHHYSTQTSERGMRVKVHIKINTGMNRLGISPQEGVEFTRWLSNLPGIEVEGVFTHFARADEPALDTTERQIRIFEEVLDSLKAAGVKPPIVHASNSAAVFNYPKAAYDMVRCGIALYGLHPSPETPLPATFKPALSLKTRLTSIRELDAGEGVGYNYRYYTTNKERIGTIAVGYADGFRRVMGNKALLRGKEIPVVGSVCMDQCMVSLEGIQDAQVGDEVVLIGKSGGLWRTTEDVAKEWGTVNYEVVCGMADRLMRKYIYTNNRNDG